MHYNDDSLAIILLCSHLANNNLDIKPLSLSEWNSFARLLMNSKIKRPGNLLKMELNEIKNELMYTEEKVKRIKCLLDRAGVIAFILEEMWSKGINVVTRADDDYPRQLKNKLKHLAPPLLYYCGDISLVNRKGIAVVGSRNIEVDALEFTKKLARKATMEGLAIYSGGARGVDSVSEQEALNSDGISISFIADSLESRIKKKEIRKKIEEKKLLLFTAVNPKSGFTVANAMNRNKYVYALSDGAFVISSDYNKGGTWAGALENINNGWVNTFVRLKKELKGNEELIKKGAIAIENLEELNIRNILNSNNNSNSNEKIKQLNLFTTKDNVNKIIDPDNDKDVKTEVERLTQEEKYIEVDNIDVTIEDIEEAFDLYTYVLPLILKVLERERNIDEISKITNVNKKQITEWINRAVEEGKVKKYSRPVRYIRALK